MISTLEDIIKVAIIGSVCRDKNIIDGESHSRLGGATYYAGQVIKRLGGKVTIYGSFGKDEDVSSLECEVIRVAGEGTIKFTNIYPSTNLNERKQKADVPDNVITMDDLSDYDFSDYDYIVYAPLFHNNISKDVFEGLDKYKAKKVLAAQGMIRYLDNGKIIWKNPENVLEVLPYVDYAFLDEMELDFISTGHGVECLKDRGARNVIVTNGSNGSRLCLEDKDCLIRAFKPIEVKDPTGAGDTYMGAYLIFKNGEFAAIAATINLECEGAFNKDYDYVLLRLFLEKFTDLFRRRFFLGIF